jgi:deoxyribodipyrimidine photolyase-related protein
VGNKKEIRLEYFYRYFRKKHKILSQEDGEPEGDQWNFDELPLWTLFNLL